MIPEPGDQDFTSLLMLARAPCEAMPGVSVLPSSVMSGPPLPLVSALVQSVTRLPQGIQSTTSLAGAADEDELLLLPLEPQPAAAPASRAAAPNAAADLVSFTRDLPSRLESLALHAIPWVPGRCGAVGR